MPTIKEIAKRANVSRGTVDRALHGRKGIKPDVAEEIKLIAETMGYTPDKAGKILASKKKPLIIGCMLPSIKNEFFVEVIEGYRQAERELSDFGVSVIIKEVMGYETAVHINAINELLAQNVSGLCISTVDVPEIRKLIDGAGIPVICVNSDISDAGRLCYIGNDYIKSGKTAAGLLSKIMLGQLDLLTVTGSLSVKGHNDRIKGFTGHLEDIGADFNLYDVLECNDNDRASYKLTYEYLKKNNFINVVFIVAGGAGGVCRAVKKLGLSDKIAVISFDDISSTRRYLKEGVIDFTICQEPLLQGSKSIEALFNYFMSGKKKKPKSYLTSAVIKIKENL
ncbi:MAG: LacI family DNA-binding transcriptional regulator [Clostridiales bacterium]|nr:LacI family DNA-binding transcriptional regulator [Clostridiales bacterium]